MPQQELLSEEIQDIIKQPPSRMVRWGSSIFLMALLILLFIGYMVKYPEVVTSSFRLTSRYSPKAVQARSEGKLLRILIQENQPVKRDQPLAYLESNAGHEQVLALSQLLDSLENGVQQSQPLPELPAFPQLGELQEAFRAFAQAYTRYRSFLAGGLYLRQMQLLNSETAELQQLAANLAQRRDLLRQDLDIAQSEFETQQKLYQQKAIALLELRQYESRLLGRKMAFREIEAALIANRNTQIAKQKEILELEQLISEQKNLFVQALYSLRSGIAAWKQRYVLLSPIDGYVHLSSFIQEKENVQPGQEVFFVEPGQQAGLGEVRIPQYNFGKVRVGQTVLISFLSYPHTEFGKVRGRVEFISSLPDKENFFLARVSLPDGLRTSAGKQLVYRAGMTATADIVTDDIRLIQRLFYNIYKILAGEKEAE